MKTHIDTYRGADIYEVEQVEQSGGQRMGTKLIAEARIPGSDNLQTDFVEEGQNREDTLKKIRKDIDHYLDEYDLERFADYE